MGRLAGSFGDIIYMSRKKGPYKATQEITLDSQIILNYYNHLSTKYAEYKTQNEAYEVLRKKFNDAWAVESTRRSDILESWLVYPEEVPQRPCPPSQPFAWGGGPKIDLVNPSKATDAITWTTVKSGDT